MLTTGLLISGKMSVGVRNATTGVRMRISSAITTNVYGLRNARATIHIDDSSEFLTKPKPTTGYRPKRQRNHWMRDGAYRIYFCYCNNDHVETCDLGEGSGPRTRPPPQRESP